MAGAYVSDRFSQNEYSLATNLGLLNQHLAVVPSGMVRSFFFLSLTLLRLKKTAVLQGVGAIKGTALKCPSGCCCIHHVIFQLGFFTVMTVENMFLDVFFGVMQPVLTWLPDSLSSIINSIRRVGFA